MLRFEHPDILWILLIVPVVAGAFVVMRFVNRRTIARFISAELLLVLAPDRSGWKRGAKQTLVLCALALLILAAANPQVGTRLEEVKREGIDLFVAMDVSLSMKAEDIRPNRLEKAKRDVSALLRKLAGDRVGLIVFAGEAFIQFPLTSDYVAADLFISSIDVESVPTPGTMIASAIDKALGAFTTDLPTKKAIIIVSDGENTEGDVLSSVTKARDANVKVYTIGMGTLEGGPIPVVSQEGGSDYKRDRAGQVVVTKLDESVLRDVAAMAGGEYYRATSGGNQVDEVFSELSTLERTEFGAKEVTGYESKYQIPLFLALLLLLAESLTSERRGKLARLMRRLLPAAGMILLIPFISMQAQTVRGHVKEGNRLFDRGKYSDAETEYRKAAEKDPESGVAQFNLGNAHFKQDRYEQALREYGASTLKTGEAAERSAGYYNMGNSLFRAQKLDEAIEAYKQALRLNPDDEDARYNLALANRKKQEQEQQQQQQQNQQQKQDQQQDKQDKKDQDQQKKEEQKQQQQQQQQDQQKNEQAKQDQTQQTQQKNQLNKAEAERILQALRANEKDLQKKLQKREGVRVRVERDW